MTSLPSPKRSFSQAGFDDEKVPSSDVNHPREQLQGTSNAGTFLVDLGKEIPSLSQGPDPGENASQSSPPARSIANAESSVKKVKLTVEDKEAKRLEKEKKDRQREEGRMRKEEEKARREEEKACKEEEKARRDAVKEAEREERKKVKEEREKLKEVREKKREEEKSKREEKKQRKEEEKQRMEEEKNKKARSQLRLNAFFGQPGAGSASPQGSPTRTPLSSRRSSIVDIQAWQSGRQSRSVSATPSPSISQKSDYKRHFADFFLHSHTTLAPINRFCPDGQKLSDTREEMDQAFNQGLLRDLIEAPTTASHDELQKWKGNRVTRQRFVSLKEVMGKLNGSASNPIDLTDSSGGRAEPSPLELLSRIPVKSIKFSQDVRPPYCGTYSKRCTQGSLQSLARKPLRRVRPDTNYDWDSEAEWEEPGEGEDLGSEDEDDAEDDDEDADLDGFLDDEDVKDAARSVKRKPLLGDLEPSCSGICWQGEMLSTDGKPVPSLQGYNIDILLENPSFPIDPFSPIYWQPTASQASASTPTKRPGGPQQMTLMEPPRLPLHPINRGTNTLQLPHQTPDSLKGVKSSPSENMKLPTDGITKMTAPKPAKRFIPPDLLDDFKRAIDGSDLSKVGLIEVLKKQFPKQPKDAIKDTVEVVAERLGGKVAERKWVLKGQPS